MNITHKANVIPRITPQTQVEFSLPTNALQKSVLMQYKSPIETIHPASTFDTIERFEIFHMRRKREYGISLGGI